MCPALQLEREFTVCRSNDATVNVRRLQVCFFCVMAGGPSWTNVCVCFRLSFDVAVYSRLCSVRTLALFLFLA
jgi:hypothetical protein